MKKGLLFFYLCFFLFGLASCKQETNIFRKVKIEIIPQPNKVELFDGHLNVNTNAILLSSENVSIKSSLSKWSKTVGFIHSESSPENQIKLVIDKQLEKHEYAIDIGIKGIKVSSNSETGFYYALQSLKQLFDSSKSNYISLPYSKIQDKPRFIYRGMHLDVCRHFFKVEEVKKYIDLLAYHKFNTFHWHLTEDQGWRIEILKYPKLQEISAYRKETLIGHYNDQPHEFDKMKYGGFYTQDEIREVVAYASERYITIIPEIEMPGHAQAALAAYPELGCTGGPYEVLTKWGISENVYCPYEKTFEFLEDVIDEVVDLFPGPYIHIGGDECPKMTWKESEFCQNLIKEKNLRDEHGLQSYFISRMEKYINSKGKKIIGWDEILEGGLAPNASLMSWRGEKGGIAAAELNHEVIMTPTSHCYFDYYQSEDEDEPLAIGGLLPLKKVYEYEPIPEGLAEDKHKYILGAQGNLWTEYIPTFDKLMYMTYPRACAMAELNWSKKENRNYDSFLKRLDTHLKRLDNLAVNYADHRNEIKCSILSGKGKTQVSLECASQNDILKYWTNRNPKQILYSDTFEIKNIDTLYYASFINSKINSKIYKKNFIHHKGINASYRLGKEPAKKYGKHGGAVAMNGVRANPNKFGDSEWLGFEGTNATIIIDFEKEETISKINLGFFNGPAYWIYPPKEITISTSTDGRDWGYKHSEKNIEGPIKSMPVTLNLEPFKTRYLNISISSYGMIPDGQDGAGHKAWLFLDEVEIY